MDTEQITGNVQDVNVSSSVIRLWARKGLIDIRTNKYHGKATTAENVHANEKYNDYVISCVKMAI